MNYFERLERSKRITYVDLSLFQMIEGLRYAFPRTMRSIERKYPSNVLPPKVYAKYKKTQRRSNAAYKRYSKSVDRTNKRISSRNAVFSLSTLCSACLRSWMSVPVVYQRRMRPCSSRSGL